MEFLLFFLLLVDAGGDTTRNLLSAGFIAMMGDPGRAGFAGGPIRRRASTARVKSCCAIPLLRIEYMRRTARKDTVWSAVWGHQGR